MKYLVPPLHIPLRINTNLPCYTKTYATTQYQLSVQHVYSSAERIQKTIQMFAAYLPITKTYLRTRYQPTWQHVNRLRKRITERVTNLPCNTLTGNENVSQNALPTYRAPF